MKRCEKRKELTVKFNWEAEVALWKGPNLYFLAQVQHFDSFLVVVVVENF